MRRALAAMFVLVVLAALLLAQNNPPINPYSQGSGFNAQGWAWNAKSARWEMAYPGAGRPDSVVTGVFVAKGWIGDRFTVTGDYTRASGGSWENVSPTSTEPLMERCAHDGAGSGWCGNLGYALWRVGNYIRWSGRVKLIDTGGSGTLIWYFGVGDQSSISDAGSSPTGNFAAFRYKSSTDSNFMCASRDGTTESADDSGVAYDTSLHTFDIVETPGVNFKYYIDGVLKCTKTTNLPTSATILSNIFMSKKTTAVSCCLYEYMQYFLAQQRFKP